MNYHELKMVDMLKDLKENYYVTGVKAEFEDEGTKMEEALLLKGVAEKAGLDLTIKIGGCGAIRDMQDSRTIGARVIVAPMIESPYAVKKYLQAIKKVFSKEERSRMKFLINIETKCGFNCIDDILNSDYLKELNGIVFGRTDMSNSLNLSKACINQNKMYEYAEFLAQKTFKYNREFIIGGGVSAASLTFFKRLPKYSLTGFETRKIIFDAQKVLNDENAAIGINKALDFELMWLKNKKEFYDQISNEDNKRIHILENRYKN